MYSGKDVAPAPVPPRSLVVIALSAAGLHPLMALLAELPANFPAAIVVLHHVHDGAALTGILRYARRLQVKLIAGDELLQCGTVHVAPGGRHVFIQPDRTIGLSTAPPVRWSRPSADWLFESAAAVFGESGLAVVLSGRLCDGARGVVWMKRAGGCVIAQSPSTCGYASMPAAAIRTGCVDRVLDARQIGRALIDVIGAQDLDLRAREWEEPFGSAN